jgi:hypothetical protein
MGMVLASPAYANWQFTTWGMTPDQVIAASGGKAQAVSNAEARGHSLLSASLFDKLSMPYDTGMLHFNADFLFNPKGELAAVNLRFKGSLSEGAQLKAAMVSKYGEPNDRSHSYVVSTMNWLTDGDIVGLTEIGDAMAASLGSSITIQYKPRATPENNGL